MIASRHSLTRDLPTPNFFEGFLLGNGDIGVCVTVRPDALGLHIGKLDVWDIRVSEDHIRHLKPFAEILEMWRAASERAKQAGRPEAIYLETSDDVLRQYTELLRSSYSQPWPRPWPCGIVWLHWDSRRTAVKRQTLDIAKGIYTLETEHDDLRGHLTPHRLECFVNWTTGHIHVSGDLPVVSVAYYPHVDRKAQMPAPALSCDAQGFTCEQRLPATVPGTETSPEDRIFGLRANVRGRWSAAPADEHRTRAFLERGPADGFRMDLALFTSLDHAEPGGHAREQAAMLAAQPVSAARDATVNGWREFWSHSAVELADRELERTWYHNQYFLACCLRQGKVAPGLFGNWSSGNIGTAWHGDYHMNYNTQQVFWGVFSTNHVEQHLPYVQSGGEADADCGVERAGAVRAAGGVFSALGVSGAVEGERVSGAAVGIRDLRDALDGAEPVVALSLHLGQGIFEACVSADAGGGAISGGLCQEGRGRQVSRVPDGLSGELGLHGGFPTEPELHRGPGADRIPARCGGGGCAHTGSRMGRSGSAGREIRRNLAPYPAADGPYGRVWLDVVDAPGEYVYNVPVTLAPVFPANKWGSTGGRNCWKLRAARRGPIRLEGGNDLVWQPLARARLGMLDLDWFKREVRYCLLPNGVANDRCRQIDGRYRDETDFDFMMRMGVWTENLSLPAVLNECMLQSYSGTIRLFPNTRRLGAARFENLRAVGAFLVSAGWDGRQVTDVRLFSEKGAGGAGAAAVAGDESDVRGQGDRGEGGGRDFAFRHGGGGEYQLTPG